MIDNAESWMAADGRGDPVISVKDDNVNEENAAMESAKYIQCPIRHINLMSRTLTLKIRTH
jgi:hypothetical protein